LMLIGFASAGFGAHGLPGLPKWPSEVHGPTMYGLEPEVYAVWEYNRVGTDVCYPGLVIVHQMQGCSKW